MLLKKYLHDYSSMKINMHLSGYVNSLTRVTKSGLSGIFVCVQFSISLVFSCICISNLKEQGQIYFFMLSGAHMISLNVFICVC